ncbi:MAG: hypothetical protein ACK4L7_02880 [Flavobacteriales bacterium]
MEPLGLDVLMIRINALMGSSRYAGERRLLEAVLEAEPAHGVAHGMLGWMLWALSDEPERAVVHLRCTVRWAPRHASNWVHYLDVLAEPGAGEELLQAADRALGVPAIDRAEVHAVQAGFHERSGHADQALTRWRMARDRALTAEAERRYAAQVRRLRARWVRALLAW